MNTNPTQEEIILDHLQGGSWVSMPKLSRESGSLNVHSRIAALRKRGHRIKNKCLHNGSNRVSFYRLES